MKDLKETAQLKQRIGELEATIAELERSNSELEQFVFTASHDLQAPLRQIASFAELLREDLQGKLDEDADENLGFIVGGAGRMQQLVQALLTYSLINRTGARLDAVDCSQLVDAVVGVLSSRIQETGADIRLGDLPTVHSDGVQLGKVFEHLIDNALKFRSSEAPRIEISARQQDRSWFFSVADNGIGIAEKDVEDIFVMFRRLHCQDEYPGVGAGLALCKRTIERHQGRIWVESELGVGSVFYFTVPVGNCGHGGG